MAKIPSDIQFQLVPDSVHKYLLSQGKVRDRYYIPFFGYYLMVATDRISAFDFVLPPTVPRKGEYLTAISHFWSTHVLKLADDLVESRHFESRNAVVDMYDLPEALRLRSLVVAPVTVMPFELIYRGHIGGSVYPKYRETGLVAGEAIEPDLPKWSKLKRAAFTPSTKAEEGHDINITVAEFMEAAGPDGKIAHQITRHAYERAYDYAERRGVIILDTKFEVGKTRDGRIVMADEKLTPDSSRFTPKDDWEEAMRKGRDPQFFDKEPVRIYLKTVGTPFLDSEGQQIVGVHKLNPENPEHIRFVHSLVIPEEVIEGVADRYRTILARLTSMTLEEYQADAFRSAA